MFTDKEFPLRTILVPVLVSIALLTVSAQVSAQPIFVTSEADPVDAGLITLRDAIIAANADPDANAILFDTSVLSCPITVNLQSELPAMTGTGDAIDGSACKVTLDGISAGAGADGLRVRASKVTVRGLTVKNFNGHGISVSSPAAGSQAEDVVISSNTLKDNGDASGDNLIVSGGAGGGSTVTFRVSNNRMRGSGRRGILISGGDGDNNVVSGIVSYNKVKNSGERGMLVSGGNGNGNAVTADVTNNEVEESGERGIFISGGNGTDNTVSGLVTKNEVEHSVDRGIDVVRGSAGNNVSLSAMTDNKSKENGADGIRIAGNVPGTGATFISGNRAEKNSGDGIEIDSLGYVLVANKAKRNTGQGINATGNVNGNGNKSTDNGDPSCDPDGCF